MTNRKVEVEQRKHKRFRVEDRAHIVCELPDIGAGRLIDISMNGLRFEYAVGQAPSIEQTELEIYVSHSGFRLYGMLSKPIWDFVTYEVPTNTLQIRQCGMEFGELGPQQTSQLEYFVRHHTLGEVD